jgi:hypothetical protein
LRLAIDSAGLATFANGIAFQSATTGTGTGTGYTLDSYEEGTFTGTLTAATPPTTPPTATGTYVKVGKTATWAIRFNNVDTSGASGIMKVTGLPFTAGTDATVFGGLVMYGMTFDVDATHALWLGGGQTFFTFYETNSGGVWSELAITAGAGKYLQLAGSYITA